MSEENKIVGLLKERFGDAIISAEEIAEEIHIDVAPEQLREISAYLRDTPALAYDFPADLAGRDTGKEIILWYRFYSTPHNRTALVHVSLPLESPSVASVTPLWPGMNWHERECFDLLGVRFVGHPDEGDAALMRILMPEDWEGHPFRKDYEPVFSGDPLLGPQETN